MLWWRTNAIVFWKSDVLVAFTVNQTRPPSVHGESSKLKTVQLLVKVVDMTEPRVLTCVSGRNQFDLNHPHSFARWNPGSVLWHTLAKKMFWISLPLTLWLNGLHTATEGQHASPEKQRHRVELARCCGGRSVALRETMHTSMRSWNID
jgi:hypothetical protein